MSVSVLRLVERGRLQIVEITPGASRMIELMERYADHPMDLADASLVWAAEQTGILQIVTIDRSQMDVSSKDSIRKAIRERKPEIRSPS